MARHLIIRVGAGQVTAGLTVPWLLVADGRTEGVGTATLAELAERFGKDRTVQRCVLIPGEQVLLAGVHIPTQQARFIRKALPYVIEEMVAEDIQLVHIAQAPHTGRMGHYDVGVIRHHDIIQWLDAFHHAGFPPDLITPDVLGVPWEGDWSLILEGDRVLLRQGQYQGVVLDIAQVLALIGQLGVSKEPLPAQVTLVAGDNSGEQEDVHFASLESALRLVGIPEVTRQSYRESTDELLLACAARQGGQLFNVRQGGYRAQEERPRLAWAPVVLAASVSALVFGLALGGAGLWLERMAGDQQARAERLYRELFPQDTRIVNARSQMQQHLAGTVASGGSGFLSLSSEFAAALPEQSPLTVERMNFDGARAALLLDLKGGDIGALETLKTTLVDQGLAVEVLSATQSEGGLQGRLSIGE